MAQNSNENDFNKPIKLSKEENIPAKPKPSFSPAPKGSANPKTSFSNMPAGKEVCVSDSSKSCAIQNNSRQNNVNPYIKNGQNQKGRNDTAAKKNKYGASAGKIAKKPAGETEHYEDPVDYTIVVSAGEIYKKSHWVLEIPLNPMFTFDNMDMSANRFAHATAMSIIDNIGTLYNPFVLYGESGTGKSHFLNAMGYEISKKTGQEKIFLTNGVRLSRGVQKYVEENNIEQLEEFFSCVEVLIIDDIHLTAVNEHNREFISYLLNRFLQEHKQIIISSKYPPESLARFEEIVNFRLDQGWSSALKPLHTKNFSAVSSKMFENAGIEILNEKFKIYFNNYKPVVGGVNVQGLTNEQVNSYYNSGINLSLIARDIKRVQVLSRKIDDSGIVKATYDQILNEMLALDGENPDSEILTKDFTGVSIHRSDNTEWGNFGFFYPQDQADKFKWMAYCVMQKAKN